MKEKRVIITLVVIIIFVIMIYFLIGKLGVIEVRMPTGYVDIFDINLECNNTTNCCKCIGECTCSSTLCGTGECQNYGNTGSTGSTSQSGDVIATNGVVVQDNEVKYTNKTPLRIFTHQSYHIVNDVIAPESQNAYQFIIRNNNKFAIQYKLKIEEENPYNINMKYRLSINGKQIIGDENNWVSAKELNDNIRALAGNTYNVYTLEWKWFESDNDTEIGTNIQSNYNLNISFFANQITI